MSPTRLSPLTWAGTMGHILKMVSWSRRAGVPGSLWIERGVMSEEKQVVTGTQGEVLRGWTSRSPRW